MIKTIQGDVSLSALYLEKLPDFLEDVIVKGGFYCPNNSLTSLEGAPKEVGGYFFCHNNSLTSLEGAPKEIGGNLWISFAKGIHFTEEEIRKVSKIKGKVYIIEE